MTGEAFPPRSEPVQDRPAGHLSTLPTTNLSRPSWFREHGERDGSDNGCWYYASLPSDPDEPSGRFDLPPDEGTCYFGDTEHVAAMERVGRFTAKHRAVPSDFVEGRVITEVQAGLLPASAANLKHPDGGVLGITGELFTMPDYSVPQAWALELRRLGHDALLYPPRFTPGGDAIACFGPSGPAPQAVISSVPLRDVLARMGVRVAEVPTNAEVTVIEPPCSLSPDNETTS